MALCSSCSHIFAGNLDSHWNTDDEGNKYIQRRFPIDETLRKGAEAECFICTRVSEASSTSKWPWVRATSELEPPNERRSWYKLLIWYATEGSSSDRTDAMGPRFVVQLDDHVADVHGSAATKTTFTGDEEHFRLVRYWLRTCLDYHAECARSRNSSWYPTRILKIEEDSVRLIETADHELSEPYATMSHCWGKEFFECLTAETLSDFRQGRLRDSFPPTFRDAFDVAEQLEIRLLWIDSFCIIQSSQSADAAFTNDKMMEIARMKDVYANAMINFGAAHGTGPQAGCFVQREPLDTEERRFKWRPTATEKEEVFCIREAFGTRQLSALYSQQGLFKRGWVMQERMLAPRMLHFADQQLYWECAGLGLANEQCPEGMPEHGPKAEPTKAWPLFSIDQDTRANFEIWDNILRTYSGLSLTYPAQDRLPAVSAIAALMADRMEDTYVAGLFRCNFLRSLCWRPLIFSDQGPSRLTDASAPSWSWASVNCPVGYKELTDQDVPLVSIEDIQVQLKDPYNPFGAVSSGEIQILGRLLPAKIFPDTRTGQYKNVELIAEVEGIQDTDTFGHAFNNFDEFEELAASPVFFLPMFWALEFITRMYERLTEPMEPQDALGIEKGERKELYKRHRIHGMLLLQQPGGSFRRLHMLFNTPAEILRLWAAKEDELLTLI